MSIQFTPADIPGMIEPIEQTMLNNLASNIVFEDGESVVEFGTFLGRSTACIASGLIKNNSFKNQNKFFAYDSFQCDIGGSFLPHVLSFTKKYNVDHLLEQRDGKVVFLPVFSHYLKYYIDLGVVQPIKAELMGSQPQFRSIGMIHIDSPKFYDEFKVLLYRFFPLLRKGSAVVFQDFFYHWSATLIAACAYMIQKEILSIEKSAASSLVCHVQKAIDMNTILEIDLFMQDKNNVPQLIDVATQLCKKIKVDREEIFLPRLTLAKIQWLFEQGKHGQAVNCIISFINSGKKLNQPILNDFLELMGSGFSIRSLYEKDHS